MGRKLTEVIAGLPKARRESIERRAMRISSEMIEASLQELRKAADMTQAQVAETMGLAQNAISQLESRGDLRLSSIRNYVEAIGGKLRVLVELPGGRRFVVSTRPSAAAARTTRTSPRAPAPARKRAARGGPS